MKKKTTSVSGKGFESDSVVTMCLKMEYEDAQLAILSSSKSVENVNASANKVKVYAGDIEDASVIREGEKQKGTIDYGRNDTGKANISGLKSEEQSLVEVMNAQVKFKHGRVSEAVGIDVQTSRANYTYGDVGCQFEGLDHANENSNCTVQ